MRRIQTVEQNGMAVCGKASGLNFIGHDILYPYIIMSLCTQGSARALYDMQVVQQDKNCFGFIMPEHIIRPLDCTDDYTYAWFVISPKMINDILSEEDRAQFDKNPMCQLTDEQVERLLAVVDQLEYISGFSEEEVPRRYTMLRAQLTVGYELLRHFRKIQDPEWANSRYATLFSRFCDLVVKNYTISRNVNYYAKLLGYEPRYFSKIFRSQCGGMSPLKWIRQYVTTQAKHIIETHPRTSIKDIAYMLGFPSTANFCRYFKQVTGITPQEYKYKN